MIQPISHRLFLDNSLMNRLTNKSDVIRSRSCITRIHFSYYTYPWSIILLLFFSRDWESSDSEDTGHSEDAQFVAWSRGSSISPAMTVECQCRRWSVTSCGIAFGPWSLRTANNAEGMFREFFTLRTISCRNRSTLSKKLVHTRWNISANLLAGYYSRTARSLWGKKWRSSDKDNAGARNFNCPCLVDGRSNTKLLASHEKGLVANGIIYQLLLR